MISIPMNRMWSSICVGHEGSIPLFVAARVHLTPCCSKGPPHSLLSPATYGGGLGRETDYVVSMCPTPPCTIHPPHQIYQSLRNLKLYSGGSGHTPTTWSIYLLYGIVQSSPLVVWQPECRGRTGLRSQACGKTWRRWSLSSSLRL